MKVALIPARGGSKRIPRKNIRSFEGRPIIAYSIDAARESGLFARIIVSTDDERIASVARSLGVEVPFQRPAHLSDDHATTLAVISHALSWTEGEGIEVEALCCVYPAAPFIRAADLRNAYRMMEETGADYCLPVARYVSPIQRAVRLRPDGRLEMFEPERFSVRSQDLEPAYHDAAQFYWGRPAAFRSSKPLFSPTTVSLELPAWRVVDIDTEEDWTRAELLYKALRQQGEF